ncbi:MAG: hydrogenase formation protein HypD, partial [Lentisphaeria bacterium]
MPNTIQNEIKIIQSLAEALPRPVQFMEVCGTHTMAVFRSGLHSLLPEKVKLLSGPGCPVCVTANHYIDKAIALARKPGVTVTSFGDMLRVPGSRESLEQARADGAAVRVVYSPLDALKLAQQSPDQQFVFLGIGFETTIPAIAWTVRQAARQGIHNYSVLCSHKTMPHAMAGLLTDQEVKVDGFLCPGHVSVIIGSNAYRPLAANFKTPCVIAGFEPADIAAGIRMLLEQVQASRATVENEYSRSVTPGGNPAALEAIREVFQETDDYWRGLGVIPHSGLAIRDKFSRHDADRQFTNLKLPPVEEHHRVAALDEALLL